MRVSYNWLQEYIEEPLPPIEKLVESLTMHSFEIEDVEKVGKDNILDVKVLPNRSHDCLSHYGIAGEVASVLKLTRKQPLSIDYNFPKLSGFEVHIEDKNLCPRMITVLVKSVFIKESPSWLKERLKLFGQRPINNIVDITNYITLAFGQPMHAFDADTISGDAIYIRRAKDGEKITLLNDKEYTLDINTLVIADDKKPLDVAGIMGGKNTATYDKTKNILLVIDNFDFVSIRKTSKRLAIRTDASVRFENNLSPVLAEQVLPYTLKLVSELSGGIVTGVLDAYPKPQKQTSISFTVEKIERLLGLGLDRQIIISLLARQRIFTEQTGNTIVAVVPYERLDLETLEDIAEEVGRLYGYEKIMPFALEKIDVEEINVSVYVSNIIRQTLLKNGFSEIYTYVFNESGDVELENPLSGDKKFLRKDLSSAMAVSLERNFKNLDLLNTTSLKLFEIGKVFRGGGEFLHIAFGVKHSKKSANSDDEIVKAIDLIENRFEISIGDVSIVGGIAEIDLDRIIKKIKVPENYPEGIWDTPKNDVAYKTISPYPFAVRDVAVFVPNNVSEDVVRSLIEKRTNSNVIRLSLFDTFIKDEKTSYAFRLVFQSSDKTLTEDEINKVMDPIYKTLKAKKGFEIR